MSKIINAYIQWKSKECVKACEEHEEGSYEIVDSSSARIRRDGNAQHVDDGHNGAAQVLKIF